MKRVILQCLAEQASFALGAGIEAEVEIYLEQPLLQHSIEVVDSCRVMVAAKKVESCKFHGRGEILRG